MRQRAAASLLYQSKYAEAAFRNLLKLIFLKIVGRILAFYTKTATRIYKKYKDNLYDNGVVFPIISNQKYNNHLKKLGKLAELKGEWIDYQYKLDKVEEVKTPKTELTSHTARRTFVVTALNEGVELDLIAQITSHSDFDNMRPYIASTRKGKQKVIDALDSATEA